MIIFHISNTSTPGAGSKTKPFPGDCFDEAMATIHRQTKVTPEEPVKIIIGPGEYLTKGFAPGLHWDIRLAEQTVLKLVDVGMHGFHHPNNYVISTAWYGRPDGPEWNKTFSLTGGTLDANWPAQSARGVSGVKFGGIHIQSVRATIKNVDVINWGSNGLDLEHSEAFPLAVATISSEESRIHIKGCSVSRQHQFQGGYATAINVVTTQDRYDGPHGDLFPWTVPRRSISAVVENNRVEGLYGHAYGCAWSERVVFRRNYAEKCKAGFNIDSGRNRNITIRDCQFIACNQGIHVGNFHEGEFDAFRITGNVFHLSAPFVNKLLNPVKTEFAYGVRLTHLPKNALISGNMFVTYPEQNLVDGFYGIGHCEGAERPLLKANRFSGLNYYVAKDAPFYREDLKLK